MTAGLGYGFDSYAVNIYGLVLPQIKRTLHITDAQAGYIGSIFLLGYTIGTIGFGLPRTGGDGKRRSGRRSCCTA